LGERELVCPTVRSNEDVEPIVGPDTDLVTRHTDNAGIPWPVHLNFGSAVQSEFPEAVDMIPMAVHSADQSGLPGPEAFNRYKPVNHIATSQEGVMPS